MVLPRKAGGKEGGTASWEPAKHGQRLQRLHNGYKTVTNGLQKGYKMVTKGLQSDFRNISAAPIVATRLHNGCKSILRRACWL